MHIILLLLNLDTQKKQGLLESLDLPDSQLPAPSLRSTRGRPAKREVEPTGEFVYMYIGVQSCMTSNNSIILSM